MGSLRSPGPVRIAFLTAVVLATGSQPPVPAAAQPDGPQTPADYETYLEDPRRTGENQEPHHAILRPFADVDSAGRDPRAQTPYTLSLDGRWRFAFAERPQSAPDFAGAAGWDEVTVPHVWQQDGYDSPIYRNVPSDIAPYDPPLVPDDRNPTGSYARSFTVPEGWEDRRTLLRFEGVTSGYFVWVNGEYAGYDQGGMTPAEFDVTDAVHVGENQIAVRVFRWGSGAYLENFDMWHLSGIFRSVWAYSVPATRVQDVTIRTDVARSTMSAMVEVASDAGGTVGRHTVRARVLDPRGVPVASLDGRVDVTAGGGAVELTGTVPGPALWTDETPSLYTLVLELIAPGGEVTHITGERFGFREITVAERQIHVNGVPVDFRGVNRHEHDPQGGRHVPVSRMLEDVLLMKRNNVNAVRTSHYPNDPAWYDLADRYGIWLVDEVDVETHYRESCPSNCLADRPEWQAAMLDRFTAMVERDKNHPSVFMWSTGNEAGLGAAHFSMADYATANDPTRLLYHQSNSPNGDAPYADVWGPRYPSPQGLRSIADSADRPVLMGEWLHGMGNSLGHYEDMWQTIRAEPALQGGFVWDWVDQGLERPLLRTPDSSGNDIPAYLAGNPGLVADRSGGQALSLSGLDDWVEVYRDPLLDLTGDTLTLDAWVRAPETFVGDFSILSKGDHSYALEMADPDTLEFFVYDGEWHSVSADVPAGWAGQWHRVTATYDSTALRIYVDGVEAASAAFSGEIAWTEWPVNIGRNSEKHGDGWAGRTGVGEVDDVRVYDRALTAAELAAGADPTAEALLALDFDQVTQDGTYLAYGSSPFLLNGMVNADRTPQPELAQMKYSHAWIRFEDVDAATGRVRVVNDYRFTDTSQIEVRWRLVQGARTLARGTAHPRLGPGESTVLDLPVPEPKDDLERRLALDAVLTEDTAWAAAGHVLATEQLAAGGTKAPTPVLPTSPRPLRLDTDGDLVRLSGRGFTYEFDTAGGTFTRMRSRGRELIAGGPELDVWRAPIGNEWATWGQAEGRLFWRLGLDRLETTVDNVAVERTSPRSVRITVDAHSQAPDVDGQGFTEQYVYDVDSTGTMTVRQQVRTYGDRMRSLPWLPRVGFHLEMPQRFSTFEWYGRGPGESYPDRKDSQHIGVWRGPVDEQMFDYLPPQETGNKTDTAWAAVSDGRVGLLAIGDLGVSVDRFAAGRDRAQYPFLLTDDEVVTFRLDKGVTGLGDTPVATQPEYRVRPDAIHEQTVVLRPLTPQEARQGVGSGRLVAPEGSVVATAPEQVVYDHTGAAALPVEVTNQTNAVADEVLLTVAVAGAEPLSVHIGPLAAGESRNVQVDLPESGDVRARETEVELAVGWTGTRGPRETVSHQALRVTCAETPTTPVAVTFVDSEETAGENAPATHAIDGDTGTIWHTQWSGASPGHPHEIQLDLGEEMDVCALHYLPRQDGNLNGTVAGYQIYLSTDGTTWGDPVAAGTLGAGSGESWIPFADTTARYVRFVALSEVNGNPWTSAAEISLDARPTG